MGKRANIRATAISTRAIAESNAELVKQARRDQLIAQGLIEFNATDGVVRAVERRLTMQRGEQVPSIGDPSGSRMVAAIGLVALLVGFVISSASGAAGAWIIILAVFMIAGGVSNASKIIQLQNDEAEYAAVHATSTA